MQTSRRAFLARSLALGAGAVAGGCGRWLTQPAGPDAHALAARGVWVGTLPFLRERGVSVGVRTGEGLSGRLALDLSSLQAQTLVTPNNRFFVRSFHPEDLDPAASWTIRVRGLVAAPGALGLESLLALVEPMGLHLIECAGNTRTKHFGLMSAARWGGIPLGRVLERAGIRDSATHVLVSGYDRHRGRPRSSVPGASWIFSRDDLEASGAFLATRMNGQPLPPDHGYPVRLLVPGWYGCTCIKWVDEIAPLDESAAATSQMKEFAGRTHQSGTPQAARDFRPAVMRAAAMPVRVEHWRSDGRNVYRVVGILWGGERPTDALAIRFGPEADYLPVRGYVQETNASWTLWSHLFRPPGPGRYRIRMKILDPAIPTPRLDSGYYDRTVEIREA